MLTEQLACLKSRGEVKALGRVLDTDAEARSAAEALGRVRGVGAVEDLDGKRLVKALLQRTGDARVRKNPIHRDEAFVCKHCARPVAKGGAQVRDHCPFCLYGQHVDRVPGDRAADCGGLLKPSEFFLEGRAGVVIAYRCEGCQHTFRVRAHPDDQLPKGLSVGDD